jgi:hypothetical protein
MIDLLATAAVTLLTTLFTKAAEKGAEEAGKSVASTLFDKLKSRVSGHAGSTEALVDIAAQPADLDVQATLRHQLRKAAETDAGLAEFLQQWVHDGERAAKQLDITQTATVSGDHNTTIQVSGSGNVVGNR